MIEKSENIEEKHSFQAEVSKLLHIVANSLYSDKDVFLRELISNASDACDKLRYEAVTKPNLIADDPKFQIEIRINKKNKSLSISDNGLGMNKKDLVSNLGTIAKSGTSAFIEKAAQTKDSDNISLIGQFGVGFYSAFMVSEKVKVVSLKAGDKTSWCWESDGTGEFIVTKADRTTRGTTIELFLKKDAFDFLKDAKIKEVIKRYSDHVGLPIVLKGTKEENLNSGAALWTRNKKDISSDQYKDFYNHVGQSFDEPWLTLHSRIEGRIEYTLLIFIPSTKPFDLFDPARQHKVRLYVKKVFVTDELDGLVPAYLRFIKGIVDSEDLNLNISREVLQNSPLVTKIKKDIVKKIFKELEKISTKDGSSFEIFWNNFGAVVKEGLYEDEEIRETIFKVARFKTTHDDQLHTLDSYIERMKDSQEEIYYITGDNKDNLPKSPQLEGFQSNNIEVLLLSDSIDDFWTSAIEDYKGKKFKSVTHGTTDFSALDSNKKDDKSSTEDKSVIDENSNSLIALLKLNLKDKVKDVRISDRLTNSPVCLVADESGMDMHVEKLLQQQGRLNTLSPKVLEINPKHELIKALSEISKKKGASETLEDSSLLLLDQAKILEGEIPDDPVAFSKRIANIMSKSKLD
ncbi:molecular chaperone HtpG [Alphaproteobacteria bacterium]|nr:molecular chaperone HtpG [Alphaproteobacteria bacterium]